MMDEDNEETGPWDLFLKSCKNFGYVPNTIGWVILYFYEVEDNIKNNKYVKDGKLCKFFCWQ